MPESIDPDEILEEMKEVSGVADVHHLHIWPISTTQVALTAHLVLEDLSDMAGTVHAVKHHLKEHGIDHSTLEVERADAPCEEHDCC